MMSTCPFQVRLCSDPRRATQTSPSLDMLADADVSIRQPSSVNLYSYLVTRPHTHTHTYSVTHTHIAAMLCTP